MTDEVSKLEKFKTAVFAEVDMRTAQIQQDAELFKEHELEKCKDKQLEKSYYMIQNKGQDIKKQCKRDVAKYSLESKRSILNKRNEITKRVFDNTYQKLLNFANSPQYQDYLLKLVTVFSKANQYSELTIKVRKDDLHLSDGIKAAFGGHCFVEAANSIKLGGFIASNEKDGVYFDETLEQKLAEQKEYFIKHSHLNI